MNSRSQSNSGFTWMEPREKRSTTGPEPNEGEFFLSDVQMPPMTFLPVRASKRPFLSNSSSHFQPLKKKSLYWKKLPKSRSPQSKPGFCFSVHSLSMLPGQVNGRAFRNCTAWCGVSHHCHLLSRTGGLGETYCCRHAGGEGQQGNGALHTEVLYTVSTNDKKTELG